MELTGHQEEHLASVYVPDPTWPWLTVETKPLNQNQVTVVSK